MFAAKRRLVPGLSDLVASEAILGALPEPMPPPVASEPIPRVEISRNSRPQSTLRPAKPSLQYRAPLAERAAATTEQSLYVPT